MDNRKRIVNLEYFREMLHICLRLSGQTFDELPFEEEILAFLIFLRHSREIRKLTHAQILWGMYHKKNVDFSYLLWEDFVYQVEHKDAKKSNEMYYPRDDQMFTMIKLVSRHQNIQQFGVMLHVELTNKDIRNSEAYKEYYAVASGAAALKTKASVRKTKSSSDTTITPLTAAGTRLSTSAKEKQPAKASKAKYEGTVIIRGVPDVPTKESDEEISWKSSDEDDDDEVDEFIHPKLSIHEEGQTKNEESFDPIVQTPENLDDKGNDDASLDLNVGSEEGQDAEDDDEELYRDVNINLEGRDVQMTDVYTTQDFKDTHVTLTMVNPDGIDSLFEITPRVDVQASTTAASLTLPTPSLPPTTIPTSSQIQQAPTPPITAPSTFLHNLPNFGLLFGLDHRLKTLEANFSKFVQTNQFAIAVSSILGIVERYMDQRINEAVKVAVQIQSDRLRDEAQAENKEFLKNLDENIQKIIKEQVKEQVKGKNTASLIEKMESNKSIHRSDEQRNLYKALVDAYESKKIILDTYGDTVILKRRRDDADKDEEPSAGSDRGSKRRREGKEPDESAPAEEPMQTTRDLEEPSHQEFGTGAADDQLITEASQHSEWFQQQKKPPTPDYTLTLELLAGPTYELMKGSCKSLVELKFFLEEVYKSTTNQLDWNNPEGQQYPYNLLKPLPLIPNSRGRRVIPFDHFINNDLEYLHGSTSSRKYTTSVTKTKAADYGHIKGANVDSSTDLQSTGSLLEMFTQNIESSLSPNFRLSNGTITSIWIGSRKADKSDGRRTLCFQRLSKNVHKKHRHLTAYGRYSTRCQNLPKEAQPHKARKSDKERAAEMIQAIDKQLKTRRIMRSLEKFVGGRLYEGYFRILQRTI
nr:hypothetical protein [Tanacetum cinerariifolium]